MPEEKSGTQSNQVANPVVPPVQIPYAFSNRAAVSLNKNDISILFSQEFDGQIQPAIRVVMSHRNFVDLVDGFELWRLLLDKLYNGQVPTLPNDDSEEQKAANEAVMQMINEKQAERDRRGISNT